MMAKRSSKSEVVQSPGSDYGDLLAGISDLLGQARRTSARAVNNIITGTYWEVGRRIVEFEQGGKARAGYGESVIERLAGDLTAKHGRGFSERNVWKMKLFYLDWEILPTPSAKSRARVRLTQREGPPPAPIFQRPSGTVAIADVAQVNPPCPRSSPFLLSGLRGEEMAEARLPRNDSKTQRSNSPVDCVLFTGRARGQESPKAC